MSPVSTTGLRTGREWRDVVEPVPARVVVLDVVIVGHHHPGRGGVRGLQVRVHLVLPVPPPVVGQGEDLRAQVYADVSRLRAALVDVVAQVQDQVGPSSAIRRYAVK